MFNFGLLFLIIAVTSAQYNPYVQYGTEQQPYNPWGIYNPYYGVSTDPSLYPYPDPYTGRAVSPPTSVYSNSELWRYQVPPPVDVPQPGYSDQPKHEPQSTLEPKQIAGGLSNKPSNAPSGVNVSPKPVNPNQAQLKSPPSQPNSPQAQPNSPQAQPKSPPGEPELSLEQELKDPSQHAVMEKPSSVSVNTLNSNETKTQNEPVNLKQNKTKLKVNPVEKILNVVVSGTGSDSKPAPNLVLLPKTKGRVPSSGNNNCQCPPPSSR